MVPTMNVLWVALCLVCAVSHASANPSCCPGQTTCLEPGCDDVGGGIQHCWPSECTEYYFGTKYYRCTPTQHTCYATATDTYAACTAICSPIDDACLTPCINKLAADQATCDEVYCGTACAFSSCSVLSISSSSAPASSASSTICNTNMCNSCRDTKGSECNKLRDYCLILDAGGGLGCLAVSKGQFAKICAAIAIITATFCQKGYNECTDSISTKCKTQCAGCLHRREHADSIAHNTNRQILTVPTLDGCDKGICQNPHVIQLFDQLTDMYGIAFGLPDSSMIVRGLQAIKESCNRASCR